MGVQAVQGRRATVVVEPATAAPARRRAAPSSTAARMFALQRQAGNAAVAGLFVQRKEGCDCGGSCCTSSQNDEEKADAGVPVALQRDADDTRIKGLFPGRAGVPDEIFFDFGKHDVPADEKPKLDTIAKADKKAKLVLRGFASEEGKKAINQSIVNNRMVMVSFFLGKFGHRGARKLESKFETSPPNIDYRRQRRVEVVRPDAKKDDCAASPVVACGAEVPKAYERAKTLLAGAKAKMSGPVDGFLPALKTFYGSSDLGVAALVIAQLDAVTKVVEESSKVELKAGAAAPAGPHHRCENLCVECGSGFLATAGPDPAPHVLFCPSFVGGDARLTGDVEEARAHILIHECGHAIGLREMARVFERAFPFLRTTDALNNTDSLTAFVRELVTPGNLPKPKADTGARSEGTDKAMAFTERWAFLSHVEANALYNGAAEIEQLPDKKTGWENFGDPATLRILDSYRAIAAEFPPMTPPPLRPVVEDRTRLAVVNDRFDRMADVLAEPVEIAVGGPVVVWTRRPGGQDLVTVPAGFDTLPLGDQCRALLRALARQTDGISAEAVEKYVRLAPKLSGRRAPGFVPQ